MLVIRRPQSRLHYSHGYPYSGCVFEHNNPHAAAPAAAAEKSRGQDRNSKSESASAKEESRPPRTYFQTVLAKRTKAANEEDGSETSIFAVDVPGFTAEDLRVQLDGRVLSVNGRRRNRVGDAFVTRQNFILDGSAYSEDAISASFSDGLLEISVRKKKPEARMIPISDGSSATNASASADNGDENKERNDDPTQEREILVETAPKEEGEEAEEDHEGEESRIKEPAAEEDARDENEAFEEDGDTVIL